jgi:signal transduction histidine kinase
MTWLLRKLSLRHVLVVSMAGLTALGVLVAVGLANREVQRSDRLAAEERLGRAVDQLSGLAARSADQRRDLLTRTGRHPELVGLLAGRDVDLAAVETLLDDLRTPADSGLPVQLWDRQRRVVFTVGAGVPAAEAGHDRLIPLDTVPGYGAFHQERGQVLYYSTAPVVDVDGLLGWIVQRRRIGNPQSAVEIQRLIGQDARILFSFERDSVWVTLSGEPVIGPVTPPPLGVTVEGRDEHGRRFLSHAVAVAGTPWLVHVDMPLDAIEAGSRAFLHRMLLAGLILVLAALAVAWLISRRVSRPLEELARAADALAAGVRGQRVHTPGGRDELDRMASAFNAMSEQVEATQMKLERQLEEARRLARDLERARIDADRARQAAESADRAKSEFLATMSHEIRTPINAVLGLAEVMELESTPSEARTDFVRRIRRAARQLATLVDDVLDIAKVEAGDVAIRNGEGSAREAVDAAVAVVDEDARRKGLDLAVEDGDDLRYLGDPHRVVQVLINLLGNAVKFTPAGGRIRVRVRPWSGEAGDVPADRKRVAIEVEDTGIGVEAHELERMFQPFVQAQGGYTREYGGTGLGLSISRRLARLMDGDVVAASQPGAGSTFALILPAAVAAGQPA